MNHTKENTMFNRKILTALVLASFALQSCSQGVAPTPGLTDLTSTTSSSTIGDSIVENLCLTAGGDTDGDGICDTDDVADDGTDCSQDAFCMDGTVGDEYVKPEKSKWWLWVGIPSVAILGTFTAKIITGDWFWYQLKDAVTEDQPIYQFSLDQAGNVEFDSNEKFFNEAGVVYNEFEIWAKGAHGYNLHEFEGPKIEEGGTMKICMNGKLGTSAVGYVTEAGETSHYKVSATYTFEKDYMTLTKQVLDESQFTALCEGDKLGIYLGLQQKDGKYYVNAVPVRALNSLVSESLSTPALDVVYKFDSIPSSVVSGQTITYHRENPSDYTLKTLDYETVFSSTANISAYNSCANDACRTQVIFGNITGTEPTETHVKPADQTVRTDEVKGQAASYESLWIE